MKNLRWYIFITAILTIVYFNSCTTYSSKPVLAVVSTHISFSPSDFTEAIESYNKDFDVKIYDPANFSANDVAKADLVMFESLGGRISLLQPQIDFIKQKTKVIFIDTPGGKGNTNTTWTANLQKYWANANVDNFKGMLSYIGNHIFKLKITVKPCVEFPLYGFYHTGSDTLFSNLQAYLNWYQDFSIHKYQPDSLTVGLVYYQSLFVKKDLAVLDALIKNIESKGQNVVALLAKGNFRIDSFLMLEGKPKVDVVIYGGMFLDFANPERGRISAKKLDVPILIGAVSNTKTIAEWEGSTGGFSPDMTSRFFFTERDGAFEPMLIGALENNASGKIRTAPIPYQVDWRVDRALNWAGLKRKNNAEKKVVVTYYSEGSGKANVGGDIDAYLNVQSSIVNLLNAWKKSGYNIGNHGIPTSHELSEMMAAHASNVGSWANAELQKRSDNIHHTTIKIPMDEYLQWFHSYPKPLQDEVINKWGMPPGDMMTVGDSTGKKQFVFPVIEYGNIILAPHPNWGLQENKKLIYGTQPIPPNHAYIAFYEWMKRKNKTDVLLTLFSQLSLMPGKQEGASANDFVGRLMGNVPHITVTPLMAGSGVKNKRRANALTIGYMSNITLAALSDSLQRLKMQIDDWKTATNLQVKNKLADKITFYAAAHLPSVQKDSYQEKYIKNIEKYLQQIASAKIPNGSHILGEPPMTENLVSMLKAMLGTELEDYKNKDAIVRSFINDPITTVSKDSVLNKLAKDAQNYLKNISETKNEISQLIHAMNGGYIETGPSDDPVRNPSSLPSGRNPYSSNDKNIPAKEAWEIGKKMGDALLVNYENKHGKGSYPKKVAFVLWSTEITNSQGVMESQIMYLMGVKPVWNTKGQVMSVKLIPTDELKRPRIDVLITTSGTYRDHFADKIHLLDTAVQIAAAVKDSNNWVRNNSIKYKQTLGLRNICEASKRVFSTAPGAYSTNLEFAAEQGDSWNNDTTLSNLYLKRMSNSYGLQNEGNREDLFKLNIMDVQATAFSRSSNILGMMDHPMVAAYYGAINLAVKNTTGNTPDMYINDLADKNNAQMSTLEQYYHKELDTRYLNPAWIKGMQAQGYDGARFMEAFTENLMLWDITKSDMVSDADWNKVYDTYVEDKMNLGLKDYFHKNNPYAEQGIMSHLLEASKKGYWKASEKQLQQLAGNLTSSVAKHGATCNTTVCNSENMRRYVQGILEKVPGAGAQFHKYESVIKSVRSTTSQVSKTPQSAIEQVKGYEIKTTEINNEEEGYSLIKILSLSGLLMVFVVGFFSKKFE